MIYEVITTDQADADLRGIYEYIAFELLSPDNVAGQLRRLAEHIVAVIRVTYADRDVDSRLKGHTVM